MIKKYIKMMLTHLRYPVKALLFRLNGTKGLELGSRLILRAKSVKYVNVAKNVSVGRDARFLLIPQYLGQKLTPRITIGENTQIGNYCSLLSGAPITIGKNCLIASFVLITSENHGIDIEAADTYFDTPLTVADVTIGDGCWIGEKATILPGCSLGKRCIVAASAVVTRSFPDECMIAGIPAKVIKKYSHEDHAWKNV